METSSTLFPKGIKALALYAFFLLFLFKYVPSSAQFGQVMVLNPADTSYIQLPPGQYFTGQTNEATIECWIRVKSYQDWARVFDFGPGTPTAQNQIYLTYDRGGFDAPKLETEGSYSWVRTSLDGNTPLPLNTWVHFAVVMSKDVYCNRYNAAFFVNGVRTQYISYACGDFTIPSNFTWNNVFIGKGNGANDPFSDIDIDEFRIWKEARNEAAIQNTMNTPLTGNEANLQLYYDMEGISSGSGQNVPNKATGPDAYTFTSNATTKGNVQFLNCAAVSSGIAVVGTPAQKKVTVKWNNAANATYYQWKVLPAGAPISSTPIKSGNIANDTLTISQLFLGTPYDFYVRSVCTDSVRGGWSAALSFTTDTSRKFSSTAKIMDNVTTVNAWSPYITSPEYNYLQGDFTVEAWVYINAWQQSSVNNHLFTLGQEPYNGGIKLFCQLDELNHKIIAGTSSNYISSDTLTAQRWYHVALALQGNDYKMYINGQLAASTPYISRPYGSQVDKFYIGAYFNNIYNQIYNTRIDEFRVWNTVRTQAEIQSTMNGVLAGNENGLMVYFDMDNVEDGRNHVVSNECLNTPSLGNGLTEGDYNNPYPRFIVGRPCGNPDNVSLIYTSINVAVFTWTTSLADSFVWKVVPAGAGPNAAPIKIGTIVNSNTNSQIDVIGLLPGTNYDFYVRGNCMANWGTATNFTTSCNIYTPVIAIKAAPTHAEVTLLALPNAQSYDWRLFDKATGAVLDSGTINALANSPGVINLINLTPAKAYEIYVKPAGAQCPFSAAANFPFVAGGVLEAALDFDGSNDYVNLGNPNSLNNFTNQITAEAWINPTSTSGMKYIVGKEGPSKGWALRFENNQLQFMYWVPNSNSPIVIASLPNVVPLNQWSHAAAVLNGSSLTLYLNGQALQWANVSSDYIYNASDNAAIGECPAFPNRFFQGKIDEVRIWNMAKTKGQLTEGMFTTLPGNTPNLVAYYKLDDGKPFGNNTALTLVKDESPNALNGTFVGLALSGNTSNYVNHTALLDSLFITNLTPISADLNANLANTNSTVIEKGFLWGIGNTLTLEAAAIVGSNIQKIVVAGAGTGIYSSPITNLVYSTQYYYRAYTLNDEGIAYSRIDSFTAECSHVNVTFSNINQNGFQMAWNAPAPVTSYFWKLVPIGTGVNGFTVASGTTTIANDTVTGLSMGASYDLYIETTCGNAAFTGWSGPFSVSTQCATSLLLPEDVSIQANPTTATFSFDVPWGTTNYLWKVSQAGVVSDSGISASPIIQVANKQPLNDYTFSFKPECAANWVGPIPFTTSHLFGNALDFDGTNDYGSTAANLSFAGNNLTAETWVYPSSVQGTHVIMEHPAFTLSLIGSNVKIAVQDASGTLHNLTTSNGSIAQSQWSHIAAVYTPTELSIFINGRKVAHSNYAATGINTTAGTLSIGGNGVNPFKGNLDETRIWQEARTVSNIQQYMYDFLALSANLIAYYHWDEGIANQNNPTVLTAADATVNGWDISLSNFALTGNNSNWVPRAPVLAYPTTTAISGTTATIQDSMTYTGTGSVSELGILWSTGGTFPSLGVGTKVVAPGFAPNVSYDVNLTGLPGLSQIHYRAYVLSTDGISYSPIYNFNTACPTPDSVLISDIRQDTAEVHWVLGTNVDDYTYTLVLAGAGVNSTPVLTGTVITDSLLLTGLSNSTAYDLYIKSNCTGSVGIWTGPYTFTTTCLSLPIPFLEDFTSTAENLAPPCWVVSDKNNDNLKWARNSTGSMELAPSPVLPMQDVLISRKMNLIAGTSYLVSFSYSGKNLNNVERMEVKWGDSPSLLNATTLWSNYNINTANLTATAATFTPLTTGEYYLGWYGISNPNSGGLLVDDIEVKGNPCGAQLDTVTFSNITAGAATAAWNATAGVSNYKWKVVLAGSGVNATPIASGTTNGTSVSISNLYAGIGYDLFLQTECALGITGNWSKSFYFKTPSVPQFVATTGTNDGYIDITWSLPVSPCLLDNNNQPYASGVYVELLDQTGGNQVLSNQSIPNLSGNLGPQQPVFSNAINCAAGGFSVANTSNWAMMNAWTLEGWILSNGSMDTAAILQTTSGSSNQVAIQLMASGGQSIRILQGNTNLDFNTLVPTQRWVHYALTYTSAAGGTVKVYIDGEWKETKTATGYLGLAGTFSMFRKCTGGKIGGIKLWNRERTSIEIQNNRFFNVNGGSNANLMLYWQWNNSNLSPIDLATNFDNSSNDGTPINAGTLIPYQATPQYTPIIGTYRHWIGPNNSRAYKLQLYQNNIGSPTIACATQTAVGNTTAFQPPIQFTATDNQLDRITLTWKNQSTLSETFRIYRNGQLHHTQQGTFLKDSLFTYEDTYNENDTSSILSGQPYNYCLETFNGTFNQVYGVQQCDSGKTFNINFVASDNALPDRVYLTWNNVSSFGYPIHVRRDGLILATLSPSATSYQDLVPMYGKEHKYGIILYNSSTNADIMAAYDQGSTPAKGKIAGKVATTNGGYGVSGVRLILQSQVNISDRDTVLTDYLGNFSFDNLYYGTPQGDFSLSADYPNHLFANNPLTLTLSDINPKQTDIIVGDLTGIPVNPDQILNITGFQVIAENTQDRMLLQWNNLVDTAVIYNLYRDNQLISTHDNRSGAVANGGLGDALSLNGTTDYLQLPPNPYFAGNFTAEAWVYPKEMVDNGTVFDMQSANADGITLRYSSGNTGKPQIRIRNGANTTVLTAQTAIPLNTWTHIAVALQGTNLKMYINGQLDNTDASSTVPAEVIRNNCFIGKSNTAGIDLAKANFDEIRIWDMAKTLGNIQAAKDQALTGSEAGLVLYYDMETAGDGQIQANVIEPKQPANSGIATGLTFPANGIVGNYAAFAGASDEIELPAGEYIKTQFTLESLVYPNSTSQGAILELGNTTEKVVLSYSGANGLFPELRIQHNGGSSTVLIAPNAIPQGQWSHIAATFAGNTAKIYINGIEVATSQLSIPNIQSLTSCYIGKTSSGFNANARIDEVRIWAIARAKEDIFGEKDQALKGDEPGLLAYFDMENVIGKLVPNRATYTNTLSAQTLGAPYTSSANSFKDITGIPNSNYVYKLVGYKLVNNEIIAGEASKSEIFPLVTSPTAFTATPNTNLGIIDLAWEHTSTNFTSFQLFRNGIKVTNVNKNVRSYTDKTFLPGTTVKYELRAVRFVQNDNYYSTYATILNVNTPSLPSPVGLSLTPDANKNSMKLLWTAPAVLTSNPTYNYSGYHIFRNDTLIGTLYKGQPTQFYDRSGTPGRTYTYKVYTFLKTGLHTYAQSSPSNPPSAAFPQVSPATSLTASNATAIGEVLLSWTPATANNAVENIDGQAIFKAGDTTALAIIAANVQTYRVQVNTTSPSAPAITYQVKTYREIKGKRYFATAATANGKPQYSTNIPVFPTKLIASQNLPNHVRLTWEYPNYNWAKFKIYRNSVLIDSLTTNIRTYRDYTAQKGVTYLYQIQAINGASSSQKVGAWGAIKSLSTLEGKVFAKNGKYPMPNVDVTAISQGYYVHTRTDSAGYYLITGLPQTQGSSVILQIDPNAANCNFSPATGSITISNASHYYLDFLNTVQISAADDSIPATISFVRATADAANRRVAIAWGASNIYADGFEVYRANTLLETVLKTDTFCIYDYAGTPGITYNYMVQPYKQTSNGKVYGSPVLYPATFPAIEAVIYLEASAKPDANKITLEWSHAWDNHSNYQITRNGQLVKTVACGYPLRYDDATGEPDKLYTYTVTAIQEKDGTLYSSTPVSVQINYPKITDISSFTASVPTISSTNSCDNGGLRTKNHVLLQWIYPDTVNISGFRLYRDQQLIGDLPKDSLSYKDYEGFPEILHQYHIKVLTERNETTYASLGVKDTAIFPTLAYPYNILNKDTLGSIRLTWSYPEDVIDGFYIYRDNARIDTVRIDTVGNGLFTYFDKTGIPGDTVNYKVSAFHKRYSVLFESLKNSCIANVIYPRPATPSGFWATDGSYENFVDMYWTYSPDANVDGFAITNVWGTDFFSPGLRNNKHLVPPGFNSPYTLKAYRQIGNQKYYSDEVSDGGYTSGQGPVIESEWNNSLGFSVQSKGNRAVIGAPNFYPSYYDSTGKVILRDFDQNTKKWNYVRTFTQPKNQHFGYAASIRDTVVLVGAPNSKKAFVYHAGTGNLIKSVTHPFDVKFGISTAINNTKWMVGNPNWYGGDGSMIDIKPTPYADYGTSADSYKDKVAFSLDGNNYYVLAGAPGTNSVWRHNGTSWTWSVVYPNGTHLGHPGKFGTSVGISAQHRGIVGAPGENKAYILHDVSTLNTSGQLPPSGYQVLDCPNCTLGDGFGTAVDIEGDFALVGAPRQGKAYLFYYNGNDTWTPTPIETYTGWVSGDSLGRSVCVSDRFLFMGAPSNENYGEGRVFWADLRLGLLRGVTATDATLVGQVKVEWEYYPNTTANVTGFRIYRDGQVIQTASLNDRSIYDAAAVPGKEYIYEVSAYNATEESQKKGDRGKAKLNGFMEGDVKTINGTGGVANVKITAKSAIEGSYYTYTAYTNPAGHYIIPDVYYGSGIATYQLTAEIGDHTFMTNPIEATLSNSIPTRDNLNFYDKTSYVITGNVNRKDFACGGIDSVEITANYHFLDGSTSNENPVYTDKKGNYSITIDPYKTNLQSIDLAIKDFKEVTNSAQGQKDTLYYQFVALQPVLFTAPTAMELSTEVNFEDTTTYPVRLSVITACKTEVTGGLFNIRAHSEEGCYDQLFTTNTNGYVIANLPPAKFIFNVEGVDNPNPQTLLVLDYLQPRSTKLDLAQLDKDSAHVVSAGRMDTLCRSYFEYHSGSDISVISGFDRYLCDDVSKPAIIQQGEEYTITFQVQEMYGNLPCNVKTGYMIVNNGAASTAIDTLNVDALQGVLENYTFTAGDPNLIKPYLYTLKTDYYASNGELLGEKSLALIVEGAAQLPGSDIIVDASNESGNVQIPTYVLRDPPGDGSFSSLAEGSTTSKTLTFESETLWGLGGHTAGFFTAAGGGLAWDISIQGGTAPGKANSFTITTTTSSEIATSADALHVGPEADVIIGAGVALQYGLVQQLTVVNCDSIVKSTKLGFSPNKVSTQWMYTAAQIQHLIQEYEMRKQQTLAGTFVMQSTDASGKVRVFSQAETIARLNTYIKNWQQVLSYRDKETLPWYNMCSYKIPWNEENRDYQKEAKKWRESFCRDPRVGTYSDKGEFLPKDKIVWDDALINKYNANATAMRKLISEQMTGDALLEWVYEDESSTTFSYEKYRDAVYDLSHGVLAKNITFGSGISYTNTFESALASSQTTSNTAWLNVDAGVGAQIMADSDVGLGAEVEVLKIEGSFLITATVQWHQTETYENATEKVNNISYTYTDDDDYDQYSVTSIQGWGTNLTPYFSLLGGRSSCPNEEGTIQRDNFTINMYDPTTQSISKYASLQNVPPNEPAVFYVQITNNNPFGEARSCTFFQNTISNPNNAVITTLGDAIFEMPLYNIPAGQSIILQVDVTRGSQSYTYNNLQLGVSPLCEPADNDFPKGDTVTFSVQFKSPCSGITITEPENGWIIDHRNPRVQDDREQLPLKLMDYETDNSLFQGLRFQYKEAGEDWKYVPGLYLTKDSLANWNTKNFSLAQVPYYPTFWDITDDYTRYPDDNYKFRAVAECGISGYNYSQEIEGIIARNTNLLEVQPADHVWSQGDEILVTYSHDMDCSLLEANAFVITDVNAPGDTILGTFDCSDNSLIFSPQNPMQSYDGKLLKMTVIGQQYRDPQTNVITDTLIWTFRVEGKPIYIPTDTIRIQMAQNETLNVSTVLLNNMANGAAVTYQVQGVSGYDWLTCDNPQGTITTSAPVNLDFTVDGSQLLLGQSIANLTINENGTNYPNGIVIIVTVGSPTPDWQVNTALYSENMTVLMNWHLTGIPSTSTDVMDKLAVWIGNELRGVANIEKLAPPDKYAALISVYANPSDVGKKLTFSVWDASSAAEYDAKLEGGDSILYATNTVVGNVSNPKILVVDPLKDGVKYIPLNAGWTMFSVNSDRWNARIKNALSSLKHPSNGDVIRTQNKAAQYAPNVGWVSANGLDSTNVHRGYMIKLAQADTLRIGGGVETIRPIQIQNGWNLIGYPLAQNTSIKDAMKFSVFPTEMTLKTVAQNPLYPQNMVALYENNTWNYAPSSKMDSLRPHFAYMLKTNAATQLRYPSSNNNLSPIALRIGGDIYDDNDTSTWIVNPTDYEKSMLITAVVELDLEEMRDTAVRVAAYSGEECRGSASLHYLPELDRYLMMMMVYSNEGTEDIHFTIYDPINDITENHFESMAFKVDTVVGDLTDPYLFTNHSPRGTFIGNVYPNPFDRLLRVDIKSEMVQNFDIRLINLAGVTITEKHIDSDELVSHTTLFMKDVPLTTGIYFLQIQGSLGNIQTVKVIYNK